MGENVMFTNRIRTTSTCGLKSDFYASSLNGQIRSQFIFTPFRIWRD